MCPTPAPAASHHQRRLTLDTDGNPYCVSDAIAFTRRFVRDRHLADPPAASDDVLLVTAELVTNAVRHADGPCDLGLTQHGARLRVTVTDPSPEPPRRAGHRPAGHGGYGLMIVERLAVRWGHYPLNGGKAVWADLSLPPGRLTDRAVRGRPEVRPGEPDPTVAGGAWARGSGRGRGG
ncbi:hypothetical protein GCM10018790_14980 [Kitasatospora xanthocidica]|uniref:ATP-binding protein n=1 Tax=Kitasatospora xanthocidica TaxID=83382 RepID=UPI00167822D5|nr:ATP-binding protein [Kitasatospora xanthocidica]GHF38289.1 hypothetical protein GCM10018790_14980 [Kitasatospora xanthocidica]